MRFLVLMLVCSASIAAQNKPIVTQTGGDCSVNTANSSNSTTTLTCYGVDKQLARDIQDLVKESKLDRTALDELRRVVSKAVSEMKKRQSGPSEPRNCSPNISGNSNTSNNVCNIDTHQAPSFSADITAQLSDRLVDFAGLAGVSLWLVGNDASAQRFAQSLATALEKDRIKPDYEELVTVGLVLKPGISIGVSPKHRDFTDAVVKFLKEKQMLKEVNYLPPPHDVDSIVMCVTTF